MDRRTRHQSRPGVERCEGRDLLSVTPIMAADATSGGASRGLIERASALASPTVQAEAVTSGQGDSPPPITAGPGDPLPRELKRQQFRAAFGGPVLAGPPRFTGQKRIYLFRGLGSSTQFLHGDYQMAIVIPRDPTAPITGAAYMQDKNQNSQDVFALDLTADPSSLDSHGRPTRLNFAPDPNIYSGVSFFMQGSGTVTIRYNGPNAGAFFKGRLYTNGITNPLRNAALRPTGPALNLSRS